MTQPVPRQLIVLIVTIALGVFGFAGASVLLWKAGPSAAEPRTVVTLAVIALAGCGGTLLAAVRLSAFLVRRRSDIVVRQSEARLRRFVDLAPVAVAMFDSEMRYLAASRRFVADYRTEDQARLIGRSHYEVFPEISEAWKAVHRRVLAGETLSSDAEAFQRGDGSVSWTRWEMAPWWQPDGRIGGVMLFTEDVTHQKAAEDALLSSAARLRLVQQISGIAYTDWTAAGMSAEISPEFAHIYGLPAEQTRIALSEFIPLIHPEDRERIAAITPEHIGVGGSISSEYRICRPDGEVRWISARAEAFAGPSGLPERVISAHQDITDIVAAREKLAAQLEAVKHLSRHLAKARDRADQANRAKSRFLAGMSHELRTPLSGILGYAQLLQMEGDLNDTQRSRLDAMQGAGKHLLQMITSVLDLSEIEAGHVEVQSVEFDVQAVAEACLDLIRPSGEAKGLTVGKVAASGIKRQLVGDPTRLRQVLLNLLGNAVKFTSRGSIGMQLRPGMDASMLRIEVSDTGAGIPAEQRQRLFNDFERLDTEVTRMSEGAGLGLALSFRLAVLMGGRLGHDDNAGGGSVFWIELPSGTAAASASGAAAAAAEQQADPVSLPVRPLRVLVVDDSPVNRDIAGSFLRAAGHEVTCADDGAEAVEAVARADFDVVLMDVRMTHMDGLEATRRIRAMEGPRAGVPIVALTAQAFTDQIEACRKAGMNSHLVKPYDMDRLLAAVAQAVALRPQHDQAPVGAGGAPATSGAAAAVDLTRPLPAVLNRDAFSRTAGAIPQEKLAGYMRIITENGEALLRDLRAAGDDAGNDRKLAAAAHALAGSAAMFGFDRLAAAGRSFEHGVESGLEDAPSLAEDLCAAVEATLREIRTVS